MSTHYHDNLDDFDGEGLSPTDQDALRHYYKDRRAGRYSNLSLAALDEYEQVAWTALHGPRTPQIAHRILTTAHLADRLTRLWADEPPTTQLRQQLANDPATVGLLDLAASPDVENLIATAMATLDLEFWHLTQIVPVPAVASTTRAQHIESHDSYSITATRYEAQAGTARIDIDVTGLPDDGQHRILRLWIHDTATTRTETTDDPDDSDNTPTDQITTTHGTAPDGLLYLLILTPTPTGHRSRVDIPCRHAWPDITLGLPPTPAANLTDDDLDAIPRSVRYALIEDKNTWEDLAVADYTAAGNHDTPLTAAIDRGATN